MIKRVLKMICFIGDSVCRKTIDVEEKNAGPGGPGPDGEGGGT